MGKVLTVSIAAYNVEGYIKQALDSLTSPETIDDLEIFVIDDGGGDRTLDIAEQYAKKYPSSVFPVHKENGGYGSTVNYSIEHATGKYFKLLDGDDMFERENLISLVELLRDLESDCVVCSWTAMHEQTGKRVLKNHNFYLEEGSYEYRDERLRSLRLTMYAMVFRTRILKSMGRKITEHCVYTDSEYTVYPIPHIKNVYVWNRPVYIYRIGRKDQSMGVSGIKKHYKEHERVLWNTIRVYEGMEEDPRKSMVETRILINIAAEFKYFCYFPMSNEKLQEMKRFYNRLKRRCPKLLQKAERKHGFVRLYSKSHGLLYPVMRLATIMYIYNLLSPLIWLRDRFRSVSVMVSDLAARRRSGRFS